MLEEEDRPMKTVHALDLGSVVRDARSRRRPRPGDVLGAAAARRLREGDRRGPAGDRARPRRRGARGLLAATSPAARGFEFDYLQARLARGGGPNGPAPTWSSSSRSPTSTRGTPSSTRSNGESPSSAGMGPFGSMTSHERPSLPRSIGIRMARRSGRAHSAATADGSSRGTRTARSSSGRCRPGRS